MKIINFIIAILLFSVVLGFSLLFMGWISAIMVQAFFGFQTTTWMGVAFVITIGLVAQLFAMLLNSLTDKMKGSKDEE